MKPTSITVTYYQDSDQDHDGIGQTIDITAIPATMYLKEDGLPDYFFTIKTDRFAFDNIDEMIMLLEDFKRRVEV